MLFSTQRFEALLRQNARHMVKRDMNNNKKNEYLVKFCISNTYKTNKILQER